MTYDFKVDVVLELEGDMKEKSSKHVSTQMALQVSKNLNKSHYIKSDGMPTKDGIHAMTLTLVQGLVGNIHHAHNNKMWDSAEHLRYIISELEKGFVAIGETSKGTMNDGHT